jgi:histo-blood group ABO system transferase
LVVVATGRYIEFVAPLLRSAQQHVVGLTKAFVLTDVRPAKEVGSEVVWLPWGRTPWPFGSLLRYRALTAYADVLSEVDVVLHIDADMNFVGPVDVSTTMGLFAVQHPGLVGTPPTELPYERRRESHAYVAAGEGERYVAGGVQGGSTAEDLAACHLMAEWLQRDLERGVVPVWHDESTWNRYCITYPPAVVLPVEYCTPDLAHSTGARIIAITKDHDRYREVPSLARLWRRSGRQIKRGRLVLTKFRRRRRLSLSK